MEETPRKQEIRIKRAEILVRRIQERIQAFPTSMVQISWKGASVIVKFTQDIQLDEMEREELQRQRTDDTQFNG